MTSDTRLIQETFDEVDREDLESDVPPPIPWRTRPNFDEFDREDLECDDHAGEWRDK